MVLFKKVKVTLTFLRKKHILRFKNTGACSPPNTKKILFETLFKCTTGNAWKLVTKTIHPVHGSVSRYGPQTSCQSKVPTIVKIPNFFSLFSYVSFSLYFFFFFEKLITTRTDLDAKCKFVQERRGLSRVEMMQRLSIADRARLSTRTNGTVPLHIKHARIITETLRPVEVMQNDDDGFARLDCHRRSRSRANNRPR